MKDIRNEEPSSLGDTEGITMTVMDFAKLIRVSLPKLKRQSEAFLQDHPILYSPLDPIALHSHGHGGGTFPGA